MGFVGHLNHPPTDDHAVIVEMLEAAGAVFYCKTNVPQTLFVSSARVLLRKV
jgi:amidase